MAYGTIYFENPHSGSIKEAPVGFSWTVLFFGFFPPLFRGDMKWAVILFILALITWGLSGLVFMFLYNKLYIKDLIGAGYKVKSFSPEVSEEQVSVDLNMKMPLMEES